jgi:hypothetical protein
VTVTQRWPVSGSQQRKRLAVRQHSYSLVHARRLAWSWRHRRPCVGQQLLRHLVQTDQGAAGVAGTGIDIEDVLHLPNELAVALGRDQPLFPEPGLELVFWARAAPSGTRDARPAPVRPSDRPRAAGSSGRVLPAADCTPARSDVPPAPRPTCADTRPWGTAVQRRFQPLLHKRPAHPCNRGLAHRHRLGDRRIHPAWPSRTAVRFQQDAGVHQLARGCGACCDQALQLGTFGLTQADDVFLVYAASVRAA